MHEFAKFCAAYDITHPLIVQTQRLDLYMLQASLETVEPIADSGRLFVRNLSHICTEEDLEALFGEFGEWRNVKHSQNYHGGLEIKTGQA